jgi:hypothetical protein
MASLLCVIGKNLGGDEATTEVQRRKASDRLNILHDPLFWSMNANLHGGLDHLTLLYSFPGHNGKIL